MKMMRCGREKAVNLMKALEEYGLIEKEDWGMERQILFM